MSEAPGTDTVVRDNALKVMKELDQQLPAYDKMYSNIYHAQIHLFEHLIKAMYADKRSVWNNIFSTPYGKTVFGWWSHLYANGAIYNLDAYKRFLQWYSQVRLNGLRNMDEQIHIFMEYYDKVAQSVGPPKSADRSDGDVKKAPSKRATAPRRKIAAKKSVARTTKTVRRTTNTAK